MNSAVTKFPSVSPWAVVRMLAGREWVRFFRQRQRVIGALGQPILFWLMFGTGMHSSFRSGDQNFMTYYLPGTLALIVLFTAIFTTISIIEDRREGFLQGDSGWRSHRLGASHVVFGSELDHSNSPTQFRTTRGRRPFGNRRLDVDRAGCVFCLAHGIDARISRGYEPGATANVATLRSLFPYSATGSRQYSGSVGHALDHALQSIELYRGRTAPVARWCCRRGVVAAVAGYLLERFNSVPVCHIRCRVVYCSKEPTSKKLAVQNRFGAQYKPEVLALMLRYFLEFGPKAQQFTQPSLKSTGEMSGHSTCLSHAAFLTSRERICD
jgi:hypothetical protein